MPIIFSILMMPTFGADMVKSVMRSDELHEFLKTDEKFDICIMELFGDEALLVCNIPTLKNSLKF